jgi:hypothetical protein
VPTSEGLAYAPSCPVPCYCLPGLAALPAGITAEMLARGAASVAEAQRAVLRHVGPHTLLVMRSTGRGCALPPSFMSAAGLGSACHACLGVQGATPAVLSCAPVAPA